MSTIKLMTLAVAALAATLLLCDDGLTGCASGPGAESWPPAGTCRLWEVTDEGDLWGVCCDYDGYCTEAYQSYGGDMAFDPNGQHGCVRGHLAAGLAYCDDDCACYQEDLPDLTLPCPVLPTPEP